MAWLIYSGTLRDANVEAVTTSCLTLLARKGWAATDESRQIGQGRSVIFMVNTFGVRQIRKGKQRLARHHIIGAVSPQPLLFAHGIGGFEHIHPVAIFGIVDQYPSRTMVSDRASPDVLRNLCVWQRREIGDIVHARPP